MYTIIKGKGLNRTTETIRVSAENGISIICSGNSKAHIIAASEDLGFVIPEPITWDEFISHDYQVNPNGYLVNDADVFLQTLFPGSNIAAITLTQDY